MTNISKHTTDQKDFELAYDELTKLIARLTTKSSAYFVDELLTDSERVMLVKRFAAIMMLHKKFTPYRISHTLTLSLSTVQRLQKYYKTGTYDNLIGGLKKKDTNNFISLLEDLIMAQVSMRARARIYNRVL